MAVEKETYSAKQISEKNKLKKKKRKSIDAEFQPMDFKQHHSNTKLHESEIGKKSKNKKVSVQPKKRKKKGSTNTVDTDIPSLAATISSQPLLDIQNATSAVSLKLGEETSVYHESTSNQSSLNSTTKKKKKKIKSEELENKTPVREITEVKDFNQLKIQDNQDCNLISDFNKECEQNTSLSTKSKKSKKRKKSDPVLSVQQSNSEICAESEEKNVKKHCPNFENELDELVSRTDLKKGGNKLKKKEKKKRKVTSNKEQDTNNNDAELNDRNNHDVTPNVNETSEHDSRLSKKLKRGKKRKRVDQQSNAPSLQETDNQICRKSKVKSAKKHQKVFENELMVTSATALKKDTSELNKNFPKKKKHSDKKVDHCVLENVIPHNDSFIPKIVSQKDVEENTSYATGKNGKKKEDTKFDANQKSLGQWSNVGFNDDARQQKFLRLMGGKKAHSNPNKGKLWSGSNTFASVAKSGSEAEKLSSKLEDQYNTALAFNLQKRQEKNVTKGLGFKEDPAKGKKFHIDVNKTNSVKFDD